MRRFATPQPPALIILRFIVVINPCNPCTHVSILPMRSKLFVLVFTLLVSSVFFSCRPSAGNSNRLLIYTPHGQDLLKDFVGRYKQRYPDAADVQFLDMGSREILERVRVERNRPQADLWWGASHTTFQTAAEENLLLEFRPTWADKVPASSRDARTAGTALTKRRK